MLQEFDNEAAFQGPTHGMLQANVTLFTTDVGVVVVVVVVEVVAAAVSNDAATNKPAASPDF